MELSPFRDEFANAVVCGSHARPAAESVGLIADLERKQLRPECTRHIGGLIRGALGYVVGEVEAVDELPVEPAQERRQPIDRRRRDEVSVWDLLAFGFPQRAL